MPDRAHDTAFVPIERLLVEGRNPQMVVARDRHREGLDFRTWRSAVAKHTHLFRLRGETRWALYAEDSIEFSILLFALLHSGKTIYVAGNAQEGTQRQLGSLVDACAGEFESGLVSVPVVQFDSGAGIEIDNIEFAPLDPDGVSIVMFTSGTTGVPESIPKSLRQLSSEVSTLEACFGYPLADAFVIGTVSHQHIYGLLFRVLWPLSTGRAFDTRILTIGEEILATAAGHDKVALVSSPSHLGRLIPDVAWQRVRGRISAVFSSTAPLEYEAATDCFGLLGVLPIEVFGSSETGGIGWRQQTERQTYWQVLPGVEVRANGDSGQIEIRSPHMGVGGWLYGEDLIEMHGPERFSLHGRADKIVKIEGKRASLTEIEQLLEQHRLIESARVLAFHRQRDMTAAVVQLTQVGLDALHTEGKVALNRQLVAHLLRSLELVVIPKRWRYVNRMPVDQQGKSTVAILQGLFEISSDVGERFPRVLSFNREEDGNWWFLMDVPPELGYFDGHFPGRPILPGVALLFWAEHYGRQLFQITGRFLGLQSLKFQQVIEPNRRVRCRLNFNTETEALHFAFDSDAGSHASGKMLFQRG